MKNKNTKIFISIIILCLYFPALASAASYDFYVDKNSLESTENGSVFYPWKTIGAALLHIQNEGLRGKTIFIKDGTYQEKLSIANNTNLIGESRNGTIVDGDGNDNAVYFASTKSELKTFSIKNADSTNIIVDKKSKVTISDCTISGAGKFGIEVKESNTAQKYKFAISGSHVLENGLQGIYISQRKIAITDNEIDDNGGEGIDLHSKVKGTVSGNNVHGNSESGVESMLAGASLTFRSNHVENNHTQGITVQVYSASRKGKVKISRNTIKGNSHYGIRFANYTYSLGLKKFKAFADKYVKLSKNSISDNDSGDIHYE